MEFPHLHCHLAVVHLNFPSEKIGSDSRFVAGAESLVDLDCDDRHQQGNVWFATTGGLFECMRTYWFIRLVLPTPLSPRMMTLKRTISSAKQPRHRVTALQCAQGRSNLQQDLLSRRHLGLIRRSVSPNERGGSGLGSLGIVALYCRRARLYGRRGMGWQSRNVKKQSK